MRLLAVSEINVGQHRALYATTAGPFCLLLNCTSQAKVTWLSWREGGGKGQLRLPLKFQSVGKISSCRKIFVQNTRSGLKSPIFVEFMGKIGILITYDVLCRKFATLRCRGTSLADSSTQ